MWRLSVNRQLEPCDHKSQTFLTNRLGSELAVEFTQIALHFKDDPLNMGKLFVDLHRDPMCRRRHVEDHFISVKTERTRRWDQGGTEIDHVFDLLQQNCFIPSTGFCKML
jgi:hypothetical protein